MRVILLGAPGSGKGSQAALLKEKFSLPHISTGDLFRDNIRNKTPLGLKVKEIIDAGHLCPDDLTVDLVKDRLSKPDCEKGYLLDGFPRNVFQAEELDKFMPPEKVINIGVGYEEIVRRICGRRVCEKCGGIFNTDNIGDMKTCPKCGGEIVRRKDDTEETVRERYKVYLKETEPLIDYYGKQGKLYTVNSEDKKKTFDFICGVLEK